MGYVMRPVLYHEPATDSTPDRVIIHCIRRDFTGALAVPRSKEIPSITEAQAEALDAIHFLAEKYQLRLDFQKGDIQYVNNFSILHARESFKDSEKRQ
jgi:CTP:phosphocholine cytidylyltransferase-like protein